MAVDVVVVPIVDPAVELTYMYLARLSFTLYLPYFVPSRKV